MNENESIDKTFVAGSGANNAIRAVSKFSNGRYFIGGDFTAYNDIGRNRIAAIQSCVSSASSMTDSACDSYTFNNIEYTQSGIFTQIIPNVSGCDSTITLNLEVTPSYNETWVESACEVFMWNGNPYNETGIFSLYFMTNAGCDSILTLDLTIVDLNTNVTQNGNTLTSSESGASYQWLDCENDDEPIANATNQSYTPTSNGSYAVEVTENGCSEISNCFDITGIDINENMFTTELLLYPNPFADHLQIGVPEVQGTIEVNVFNTLGSLISNHSIHNNQSINLSSLPSGIYFVKVIAGHVVSEQVVVKK